MRIQWLHFILALAGATFTVAFLSVIFSGTVRAADAPSAAASAVQPLRMTVPATLVDGLSPSIRLSGLAANEVVRLHAMRSPSKWQNRDGQWQRVRQPLHAYADFAASADGVIEVASALPLRATYAKPDPLALLRTGLRFGAPALQGVRVFPAESVNALAANRVQFTLERNGQIAAEAPMDITEGSDVLLFE